MQNKLTPHDLLELQIEWKKEEGQLFWSAVINGQRCELIMNDFPDEPLYTLKFCGQSIDIDDAPKQWIIPSLIK